MNLEQQILNELKRIIDPDLGQDIVNLGFIKNLKIDKGAVSFDIELTTGACPIKEQFKNEAERLVLSLDGVESVDVTMTAVPKKSRMSFDNSSLQKVQNLIAVSSCKGGVGKSTVAALLAKETAARGLKVGLVDLDLFGPSVPILFRKHERVALSPERKFVPHIVDGVKLMSFGFLVGDAPAVIRGPIATNYTQQLLHNTDWGELDYLFLDMPPGTGDIQLTITQTVPLNGAVVVTTRQALSLADVARGIKMFEKVNVPLLGVIENMVYFVCGSCQDKHYIFGGGKDSELTQQFGLEVLAQFPLQDHWTRKPDLAIHKDLMIQAVDALMRSLRQSTGREHLIPEVDSNELCVILHWKDQQDWILPHRELRLSCRCAHCVDELTGQQLLQPEDVTDTIRPEKIEVLGNYALSIQWNDGHSSGIYPYVRMKELL